MTFRVDHHVTRGAPMTLLVDGREITAHEGETIATAMLAAGLRGFRRDSRGGWRAPYCNMGACHECLVRVRDPAEPAGTGASWTRACMAPARPGLVIQTGEAP
jgi:NADH dehydrogenase/NADH:ubiquinone oxidoreductase subunit G